jgi:hypothetical protein
MPRSWNVESAAAAILAVWRGEPALFGRGGYGDGESSRIGLLCADRLRPRLLWHGHLPDAQVEPLFARLAMRGPLARGGLDFMFASDWKVAWTEPPFPFRLYDRAGLRCELRDGAVRVRGWFGCVRSFPAADIRAVRAEGFAYRARSRALLVLDAGLPVAFATSWDLAAPFTDDPWAIYEEWAARAATSLATALAVPVERAGDL